MVMGKVCVVGNVEVLHLHCPRGCAQKLRQLVGIALAQEGDVPAFVPHVEPKPIMVVGVEQGPETGLIAVVLGSDSSGGLGV